MRGVSSLIAIVLIVSIAIALVSSAYIFLTSQTQNILEGTEESFDQETLSALSKITIGYIDEPGNMVNVRNIGKVSVNGFQVFVNNVLSSNFIPLPISI